MRSKPLPLILAAILGILIVASLIYTRGRRLPAENPQTQASVAPAASPEASPSPGISPNPSASPELSASPAPSAPASLGPSPVIAPDLTTDANGLSKATLIVTTNKGVIKFKLYPHDAPNTVKRIIELTQQGFYNGLTFHRVVPGFVIQGGDPKGDGTGGSGQKLKAEFNNRRHIEGTVAMARGVDPDSADSQFYISLGTHPHLDRAYTVFGQVIEGMDVARKIERGDKIVSVRVE